MGVNFYKVRAVALEEHEEHWLTEEEMELSEPELAELWGIDPRVFRAIRGEERARNGKGGIQRWAMRNPELAELLRQID